VLEKQIPKSNPSSLSGCHSMADVFRFMADEVENSITYSGFVLKNDPEKIQDFALNYLQMAICFERKNKREKLLLELKEASKQLRDGSSIKDLLNECVKCGVTVGQLVDAGVL